MSRLHVTAVFRVGVNDWYVAQQAHLTCVLKVRHDEVQELGIAVKHDLPNARQQSILMHSFY